MDINRFVYRCVYEFVRVCVWGGGDNGIVHLWSI